MAEQIPHGVATSLINKIASLAFREIGRIYGVMDDLEKLKDTLESIRLVLSDAELKQGQDATVAHWIKRFKQVLYDADDLLDDIFIKDLRRKRMSQVRGFFSKSVNPILFRAKLARKIENIRKEFNNVAEEMSKLNLNQSSVILKQDECAWRETSSSVLQSEIVGREENKSDIVNLLKQTHPNQNVSLIVVVGMGGLGKTALAQLVYNAAKDQKLFQKYMWVCVSEDFKVKTVLKKMLESLGKDAGGDSIEALQQKLREELNGQNYMLVLDDVWNEDHSKWSDLRTHLMCGGQGSKLLVTTRSTLVSQAMGIDEPYVLRGLTDEQSWTLLKNLTFGEDSSRMSSELQTIGEEIAKKCRGVPLAIKTVGGFLRIRVEEVDEWSSLLHGDIWRLCEEENSIMPVLNLSYRNLLPELRQCFAFCCLYPKDSVIKKDELIELWMAQGYLASPIETQSTKDVGNQYVKILLMRSFFQDASMDENGHIRSFKMHDLMHDLATLVAGNDCYLHMEGKRIVGRPMHVAFVTSTDCSLDVFDVSKLRTIIHCVFATNLVAKLSFMGKLKCLRALNLSFYFITQLPKSIDKVKHLRYLDLSYSRNLRSLPESIGNLVCLQTLKLKDCESLLSLPESIGNLVCLQTLEVKGCRSLLSFPESIGNLVCLQTLKVNGCGSLVSLPESVGNLICLQSLILNDCWSLVFPTKMITKLINLKKLHIERCKAFEDSMPVGLGKLISLQSLPRFVVGNNKEDTSGKLNELKELVDLRGKLTIGNLDLVKDAASESQETNMRSKKHIQDLSLLWGPTSPDFWGLMSSMLWGRRSDSSEYEIRKSESLVLLDNLCPHQNLRSLDVNGFPGVRFSDWLISLIHVVRISLSYLPNCKHLPPLERLPCLRELELNYMESLEWMDCYENIGDVFFPSLEKLVIHGCENLRGWEKNANETQNHLSLPPFPRLLYLQIDCPKLTCMPPFPHLVELELGWGSSVKPMLERCMVKHDSSSISPLSHLKRLRLSRVTDIEAMAEDWMKNLTSLQSLELNGSSAIQILSRYLQYLPSQLENLEISFDDEKLDLWKHTQGRDPPHALSSLQTICFSDCENMKAIPEQIGNLQSLRLLKIANCPKLESLDEADRCLPNIHTLQIYGCPILKRKYDPECGEDRAKIAHIPVISISWY
ncbi:putative disease resistance protein RGA1 [Arachis duranensis]|uniref:Disease resistance protein RGA1 n=1 Tax=Arachis duranensis TaxID=130453 RepID=A0A9C6TBW4_ARADU|nr:putative disease resistance protein RGA1 [Arachis duranensis]XP_052111316.1 putative disease resistance protein RGA1 [Arachis duranensis]XP_052111317.1 putative disease resistance protein RGA1 [Arachis duranensis]XP_052111318.1 putative disease resistance protein RGA1 [Arachis duranensis]XP_052111319.1 putative disease resistance protein RGA1 [Arachis duranensis]XP_052111320.1 putative disease resistance protein RGA1 [Arachis duranensis]XP_052111321.1 putative disease resistance protein RG